MKRKVKMISAEEFLSYLGTSTVDHELRCFLTELDLPPKGPPLRAGFGDQRVRREGVVLLFKAARHHPEVQASRALTPSSKVLSDVTFMAVGLDGGPPFSGELPYGLRFSDSRAATRARLGPPSWTSPPVDPTVNPTGGQTGSSDRWEYGARFATVDFSQDASHIERVTVGLAWKLSTARRISGSWPSRRP